MVVTNIKDPNVKMVERLTEKMTLSCKEKCEAYRTTTSSSIIINDSSQVNSSFCNFHCKYKIISKIEEGSDFVKLLGEKKSNGCKVVVTKELCKDSEHLKRYLKDGMPKEAFNQQTLLILMKLKKTQ